MKIREEGGGEAEGGEDGAEAVDEGEAGVVDELAEDGGAEAAETEGEAEEDAGDEADAAGEEFLGVDEDG